MEFVKEKGSEGRGERNGWVRRGFSAEGLGGGVGGVVGAGEVGGDGEGVGGGEEGGSE